jgi:hypothetical protein
MRPYLVPLLAALALPATAENTLPERERQMVAAQQRLEQERRERAQARCIEQRGVDCDTEQGLREWLLLEQSREEALLNRYGIVAPGTTPAGAGASAPSPAGR